MFCFLSFALIFLLSLGIVSEHRSINHLNCGALQCRSQTPASRRLRSRAAAAMHLRPQNPSNASSATEQQAAPAIRSRPAPDKDSGAFVFKKQVEKSSCMRP